MEETLNPRFPREIGPYRIESRLGAGGMGEVYRAYDQRLDRSVAVKLIRPEDAEDAAARERLRREARAAARVSHPSVVQVFDILDCGEDEAIVMELVEGELLSRRLRQAPLDLETGVRLGREIAEGLAAAHARGILHRDLKAENVMVTTEGHAKILDFGLARKAEDPRLTQTDVLIGTYRCMSPEQVQGLPLDRRSDLFSLGVLLYEALTGRSPFQGSTIRETLNQICTQHQTSVREIRSDVPQPLSRIIDELLEKDPRLRPGDARKVAARLSSLDSLVPGSQPDDESTRLDLPPGSGGRQAAPPSPATTRPARRWRRGAAAVAILLLAAMGTALWVLVVRWQEPIYVAVPPPEVVQGASLPGIDVISAGLHSALLSQLASFRTILPLEPERRGTLADARGLARSTGADEVLMARLRCGPTVCQVSLSRVRGRDGALLDARTFSAPVEQPYLLPEAVLSNLRSAYPERPLRARTPSLDVREEDYEEYLRLAEEFDLRRGENVPAERILARLSEMQRSSPRFLEVPLLESYILLERFRYGRKPEDLDRVFAVLHRAQDLAPNHPRVLASLFEAALLGNRLEQADTALRELERVQPGDARLLANQARLLYRRGETQRALPLLEAAVRRLPSWHHFFWLAEMEYHAGKVEEARRHLHELLRRSPGNYMGESLLSQLELYSGSPRKAAEIYARLARRSPQYDVLSNLGLAELLSGRFTEAERSYRQAVELQPRNPFAVLNLADACLLSGRQEEGRTLYRQVIELAEQDPGAGSDWQLSSVRAQALAHLGHRDEAVAAVQQALRLAPDNPQAAYEASLVYTLLADQASARFNARRALEQGIGPRWFSFPWFAPLRDSPELRGLLTPQPSAEAPRTARTAVPTSTN